MVYHKDQCWAHCRMFFLYNGGVSDGGATQYALLRLHLYADDSQIYTSAAVSERATSAVGAYTA